ncbi:hypothetical protein [Rhizobium sp. BK661]|uniref:hypothetical protein n=1 Tax=Rhizobium sp. BK661 TaxID=2586991 RepID=UPI0021689CB4|nr:hypothetical protein [Rhizobium sp. BK661]MCS3743616.1 hypothetical protein [Rhizobium sp. BK661]
MLKIFDKEAETAEQAIRSDLVKAALTNVNWATIEGCRPADADLFAYLKDSSKTSSAKALVSIGL